MSLLSGRPPKGSLDRRGIFDGVKNPDIASRDRFRFPRADGAILPPPGGIGVGPQPVPHADPPGQAPWSRLQFPPYLVKIPKASTDFRQTNYQVALPVGVGSVVAGPSFQLPKDSVGWLQNNTIYCLTPTGVTSFSLAIRINNGPVPGFDDIRITPGVANYVLLGDDDMQIRVPNGALVSTLFTNLGGTAETVGALIQGWYHPMSAEARIWGDA